MERFTEVRKVCSSTSQTGGELLVAFDTVTRSKCALRSYPCTSGGMPLRALRKILCSPRVQDESWENLVPICDVLMTEDQTSVVVVMPWLNSHGTLFEYLKTSHRIPVAKIRSISRQLVSAIQGLHRRGYIHGHIDPKFIFLRDDDAGRDSVDILLGGLGHGVEYSQVYSPPEVLFQGGYEGTARCGGAGG
eukprot:PhF_6_TR43911/c0_g1_i1/m.67196